MTVYLARYDRNGNCQYVAIARSQAQLDTFLDAGFVEVDIDEYERCKAIVEETTVSDVDRIVASELVLATIAATSGASQQVPVREDRNTLDNLIANFERTSQQRMESFLAGGMTIDEWYSQQSRHILRSRLAARASGVGGIQNLTSQDIQGAELATRRELTYLAQFRDALDSGTLSEREAIRRVRMYAGGNREQFERARSDGMGLPTLPAYPGVRTDCRKNCKCRWRIVILGGGDFNCFWIRSPVDSCDTCRTRERAFNPLEIRGGQIQTFPTVGIYSQPQN